MIHNGILIVIYYNKLVVRLYDIVDVILQNCMIEHLRIGEKYRDCQVVMGPGLGPPGPGARGPKPGPSSTF